ncbi:hypothetical protein V2G26_006830 [Clonostachys chloroleuca]|uniref:Uncharacterized protein n=1 Tax=Clonostachys chloroleuca TaxID=1926264 RepID=A0AA35PZC1_9HYPO|nr:unnamed protein product [Clonostachys chloroleuca]
MNLEDDPTSDYDESIADSEFTSVSESRLEHTYENGRRYQGLVKDRYGLPNDDTEQLREGLKHKLYMDYIFEGKICSAPIGDHPQKIVDLGTGFGFWASDAAEKYPGARIIGTDISPIQPLWAAPNVEFHVEDLEDEVRPWTSIYGGADLFFIRATVQTLRHPRRLIERCFENLKPGGWIECHDVVTRIYAENDAFDTTNHPMTRLYSLVAGPFSEVFGWNLFFPDEMPTVLRETGFVNVQVRHKRLPIGRWHHDARLREIGSFAQSIVEDWGSAMMAKHEVMGLSSDEANQLLQDLFDSFNDLSLHGMFDWIEFLGQKPQ